MFTQRYQHGVTEALTHFGVKEAGVLKDILIGNPQKYVKQLRSGKLFTSKGLIAQGLDPVNRNPDLPPVGRGLLTAINAAGIYGFPAYQLYQAATQPAGHRGSSLGAALGGIAGGTLGLPLGALGSVVGGTLGSSLGEALGRNFNSAPSRSPLESGTRDVGRRGRPA